MLRGNEGMPPSFSPEGRWLAFSSNPTGRSEIYVMDFPSGWRRDGKELFYVAADGSMMHISR
jgi:Tol biopolymer transport system component